MADKKISQLTALAAANLAPSTDVLAIVDTSATETKKIVAQDLVNGVLNVASAVGIGTASPGEKLAVNGSIGLQRSGTQYWHYGVNASNALVFTRSGVSDRLTLDSDGNLGLGVTPSAWGSGRSAIDMGANAYIGGTSLAHLTNNVFFNGTNFIYKTTAAAGMYQIGSTHAWFTAPSGTINTAISFTQAMTLDASGNLSLGTTTSGGLLTLKNANPAVSLISVQSYANTNEIGDISFDQTTDLFTFSHKLSSGGITFQTNSTERARITSGGITLFGKTNDYSLGTQPGYVIASGVLSVASDNTASANNRNWAMLTNGYENGSLDFVSSSANNTWANDAYRMSVTRAGSTYNTTGTYGTLTSDERLKQDIADASSQWDDMKAIRFRKFRMKAEVAAEGDNAVVRLGVIAQEAAATSPNLVTRRVANEHDIRVVPELEKQEVLGFKDSVLFWKAAKALQEAMARIESLEADVAALKGAK